MLDKNKILISSLWQRKYQAAAQESDPTKLAKLVLEAENAIFERLQELAGTKTPEHEAIQGAIKTLRELQVTKLNFPQWDSEQSTQRSV
jgi:hypothetical protein